MTPHYCAARIDVRPRGRTDALLRVTAPVLAALGACMPLSAPAQTGSLGVTVAFSPTSIASGGTSQMSIRFSITGPNPDGGPAVLQQTFADALPPGLTVATASTSTCAGAGAAAGASTLTFASGGSIPAAGCTVTVAVTATAVGGRAYFTNTIPAGALVSSQGTNPTAASATLTVQPSIPVPDVSGLTQQAAAAQLAAAGFAVSILPQPSTLIPRGGVIGTLPAAGTAQPLQSTINLLVSSGPGTVSGGPISSAPGLTPAQVSVARSLEQVCTALANASTAGTALSGQATDLLAKCSAIIGDYTSGGNLAQLGQTLTAISGRQATAAARTPMQFSAGQVANLQDRLAAVRGGARGVSLAGLEVLGGTLASFTPLQELLHSLGGGAGDEQGGLLGDRLGLFATGTLRRGRQSSTDAESGFDLRDTGLTVGADYRLEESLVLGLSGGYGRTTTGFDGASGRLDARSLSGQLYGSYFTDHFHLDAVAGFGHTDHALTRELAYSSSALGIGCDGVLCQNETTGSTSARQLNASLGVGGDFHSGALAFGPTLELEYRQVRVNGFTETGSSGLDLSFGGITTSSLVSKVGSYASYAWKTPWAVILPQARVRYLHEYQNAARTQSVQFSADTLAGAASRGFVVFTDPADRSYFDWKASVLVQLPFGVAGFVDYGAVQGLENKSMHELNVGLRLER